MKPLAGRPRSWNTLQGSAGFSLVEVLMALGLASIAAWAILNLEINQSRSAANQAEVVAMQQGLRGSLTFIARELKKAGYDPSQVAGAGIVTANARFIYYTQNNDGNTTLTGATEHAAFCFADNTLRFTEGNSNAVGNHATHAHLDVMTNVQDLEFLYLQANGTPAATPADTRLIQITILARTRNADPKYRNAAEYVTPSGTKWGPYNDGFRRQMSTTTVQLWNM